uniref:Uncharacterized protein n=1 Tax=Rhodosorus marinus TaxID=101924 RepID=A0A7S2ZCM2_9RHOD|mmetsp:Transcript_12260/g.50597  ORF Transcript_12260/g.50597 Transcript_12260/m.50597 type:complete len:229 (+) Transcript_12260:82-768(+)
MVIRGELFWEELELRRLLTSAQGLFDDVRSGRGGVEVLREVVRGCRTRLDVLKRGNRGWKECLGNPGASTLAEYERRTREVEAAFEGIRSIDSGRVPERQELLGLRHRGNQGASQGSGASGSGGGGRGLEEVEQQREIQEELMNLLLVRVSDMKHGAEKLNNKIKESSEAVEDVDRLVDSNLEQVGKLRGQLGKYSRASWFYSFRSYILLAIAVVVWVLVVMAMFVIR